MKSGFTMKEYMAHHGIAGSPFDSNVNKMLREHFRDMGLVQVRSGNKRVWIPAADVRARTDYARVAEKLKELSNE